jgi:hypothetical protein
MMIQQMSQGHASSTMVFVLWSCEVAKIAKVQKSRDCDCSVSVTSLADLRTETETGTDYPWYIGTSLYVHVWSNWFSSTCTYT